MLNRNEARERMRRCRPGKVIFLEDSKRFSSDEMIFAPNRNIMFFKLNNLFDWQKMTNNIDNLQRVTHSMRNR